MYIDRDIESEINDLQSETGKGRVVEIGMKRIILPSTVRAIQEAEVLVK